jgi:hypothetical protein
MRRIIFWCAIVVLGVFCFGGILAYIFAGKLRAIAFERTELYLGSHLQSTVQISDFHVLSFYPFVHITLDRVVLLHQSAKNVPPLLQVSRMTLKGNILGLMRRRPVVDSVELDGLQISVPPRRPGSSPLLGRSDGNLAEEYPVTIREIRADDALLLILPRDPARAPREFRLHHLELRSVDLDRPATFSASLRNPVPAGEIETSGTFGPWNGDNPAATPVRGNYVFQHADLGTLKGLRGILRSTGKFSGPLDYLEVNGSTDVPNFSLRTSERPVALHTDFSAIVDGTNGNTILKHVAARFLRSRLDVDGEVVDKTPKHGRTISLNAVAAQARVEDFLVLAVDSNPPVMTGTAKIHARVLVGEGSEDIIERLSLSGQFDISRAHFTSDETERKIDALSLKGQGRPRDLPTGEPPTEFAGLFRMTDGVVSFSKLNFDVPGASVALGGTYTVDSGELDFRGKLRLVATLSKTTTGVKSILLKPVDPFFKGRNAGTVLPIKITGNKANPSFALDFRDKLNKE